MAFQAAKLQAVIGADTSEFQKEMKEAENTLQVFAKKGSDSASQVQEDLRKLADAGLLSADQIKNLQRRMEETKGLREYSKFLKNLGQDAGYSNKKILELARSMGVSERLLRSVGGLQGGGILGSMLGNIGPGLLSSLLPVGAITAAVAGAMAAAFKSETPLQQQAKRLGLDIENLQSHYDSRRHRALCAELAQAFSGGLQWRQVSGRLPGRGHGRAASHRDHREPFRAGDAAYCLRQPHRRLLQVFQGPGRG